MNENNLNITFDIIRHAKERPGAPALVTADREISYSELDKLVWMSAQYLHNQGVRMGDVVAFSFQSELLRCLVLLGLARLGATSLCIPNSAAPLQRITWEIAAQAIVFVTDRSGNFSSGLPTIHFDRNSLAGGRQTHFNIMPARADTYISIGIGSGTTGRPKLIPITHRQMRGRCAVFDKTIYQADSRALYLSSLEFTSTQTLFLCLLNIGAAFIFPGSKFTNPAEVISFSRDNRVNIIGMSVFHAENLLKDTTRSGPKTFSFLKTLKLSSSTVSDKLRLRIREHLTENLAVVFGTNECLSVSSALAPSVFEVAGTVGKPLNGIQLEIVDMTACPVKPDSAGMIRMKSPGLIDGYLNDPESTSKAFVDGWFYSGDFGKMTEDGHLIHLGRSDQMMIYNGINIYPGEIEACLAAHPSVADVAAFPLRHPVHQHLPVCAVSLRSGSRLSMEDLQAYAVDHLGIKAPKKIFTLDEIPRNEQGKLVRSKLVEKIRTL